MDSQRAREHGLQLNSVNDAMDVMSSGLQGCIFTLEDVAEEFFDLSNGLAGEVFQKFINYQFRVVFVVPPDHCLGARVTELAREHARHPIVRIVQTLGDAETWLRGQRGA